jgi:hypothetical protein
MSTVRGQLANQFVTKPKRGLAHAVVDITFRSGFPPETAPVTCSCGDEMPLAAWSRHAKGLSVAYGRRDDEYRMAS